MNWKQILSDLQAHGVTQQQLAKRCGCSQASISELARGKPAHPKYPIGVALLAEHKKVLKRQARKERANAVA